MTNPVFVAAPVTLLPAIGALWYLLRRYDDYFEDGRVFLALTLGLFGGLLAAALERLAFPFADPLFIASWGVGTAFLAFVVGYAFFETGVKVAVLGGKKFRQRKDAPFYGAALGLGMGAMMALGFVSLNLVAVGVNAEAANATRQDFAYAAPSFLAMAALPVGAIFVHGASAVFAGRHVAEGKLAKAWLIGAIFQMPALGAFWLFWPSIGRGQEIVVFPALLAITYGVGLLHIARSKVLDSIVPQHIKDMVARQRRRDARRDREEE